MANFGDPCEIISHCFNYSYINLLGSSVGCDEDGRGEEGGTGDEEAQGTTSRGDQS